MASETQQIDWRVCVCALIIAAVFVRLGVWQIGRLEEKRALQAELDTRALTPAITDLKKINVERDQYRPARLTGYWQRDRHILVRSRNSSGQPGHEFITPLKTANGIVLVNRGWAQATQPGSVPLSDSEVVVTGTLLVLPSQPFYREVITAAQGWPLRVPALDGKALEKQLGLSVSPLMLTLSARTEGVLEPVNTSPMVSLGSHRSYALQWFAMAAICLFLMVVYIYRRTR